MSEKTYKITFDFAMWRLNFLKNIKSQLADNSSNSNRITLYDTLIDEWQNICSILCPEHLYEIDLVDEEYSFRVAKCKNCGHVFEQLKDLDYAVKYFKSCYNCIKFDNCENKTEDIETNCESWIGNDKLNLIDIFTKAMKKQ